MKYSKTTLMELSHRYSKILKKCALLNATILMGAMVALPAMADTNFTGTLNSNLIGLSDVGGDYNSPTTLYFVPKGYSASIGDGFTISKNVADSGILGTSGSGARSSLTIEKSTFSNNEAKFDGGAIASFGDLTIKGTAFTQNIAQTLNAKDEIPIGGGAIALGAVSKTNIQGGIFTENESKYSAGAIGTRDFYNGANANAFLDITGSTFTGNIAAKQGGAIDNYFYHSDKNTNAVYIEKSIIRKIKKNGTDRIGNTKQKTRNGKNTKRNVPDFAICFYIRSKYRNSMITYACLI
jgi:predicted outer membrane repeat protein